MKKKKNTGDNQTIKSEHLENQNENTSLNDASMNETNEGSSQNAENTNEKNKEIEELKLKINEMNDKYLRLYSEFDNYRKRTIKEKVELNKMATTEVILSFLPVLDDFDRAIKTMIDTPEPNPFNEGFMLIYNKLKKIINQHGVEEMKSIGESFNTDLHEAITNIPAETEDMKGKIADEILKGYLLNGKVIRYAKVVVAN